MLNLALGCRRVGGVGGVGGGGTSASVKLLFSSIAVSDEMAVLCSFTSVQQQLKFIFRTWRKLLGIGFIG